MTTDITMPALSPTMEKGNLAKWRIKPGDEIRTGDIIAEIETDKATMELEAAENGFVKQLLVMEGTEDVAVGQAIAVLGGTNDQPIEAPPPVLPQIDETARAPKPSSCFSAEVKATPLAKRLAFAEEVDLSRIRGSGPNGRIIRTDVVSRAAPRLAMHAEAAIDETLPPDVPHEAVKLSSMRKTIARRLSLAKREIPHFYLGTDIRLDPLLALRGELNTALAEQSLKLSVNDFLIKALALALTRVPNANVQLSGDALIKFHRADIALAVAVEGGLITPVIRDAGAKSISAISAEAKDLAARGREGKLRPEEYHGGTASLSNLGMYGIQEIVPVLNPPQALILGIGAGARRPFAENEMLILATVMTATGSFDHRAIDGATGAEFLAAFRYLIEKPLLLLA